jgi:hypothetical protein
MKRSRSNDGSPNQAAALLPISKDVLRRLLIIFTSEPVKRREPRIFAGPKVGGGRPISPISDEQVIAMRKMKEWYGMTHQEISDATGFTMGQIAPILRWDNRVHLDPGPRPAPSDGTPPAPV